MNIALKLIPIFLLIAPQLVLAGAVGDQSPSQANITWDDTPLDGRLLLINQYGNVYNDVEVVNGTVQYDYMNDQQFYAGVFYNENWLNGWKLTGLINAGELKRYGWIDLYYHCSTLINVSSNIPIVFTGSFPILDFTFTMNLTTNRTISPLIYEGQIILQFPKTVKYASTRYVLNNITVNVVGGESGGVVIGGVGLAEDYNITDNVVVINIPYYYKEFDVKVYYVEDKTGGFVFPWWIILVVAIVLVGVSLKLARNPLAKTTY